MKKIYALLVGINQYQSPVPRLNGCVRDVERMQAYLEQLPEVELHLKTLSDSDATKENITGAFLSHLGQAKEADVAFFYFSGHGTQEEATQVFWKTEPSRRLQSLVCHDSLTRVDGRTEYRLIANKELRYLIHRVTRNGGHLLTVFDCCHSGQNTRSASFQKRQYLGGNGTEPLPERSWSEFLFAGEVEEAALLEQDLSGLLPEGRHVQIAACLPEESAFEESGEGGVFTRALLEVLDRSDGKVTYYDLQSRLRNFIKNNFRQTPQIYLSPEAEGEAFRFFLDNEVEGEGRPLSANVVRQPDGSWWMDMGHLHGVSPMAEQAVVYAEEDRKKEWKATIAEVEASRTRLEFEKEPAADGHYRAYVDGFLSSPVKVYLKPAPDADTKGTELLQEYLPKCGRNLLVAEEEYAADYTAHISPTGYDITFAEDDNRPLVRHIRGHNPYSADLVCQYLRHISQWEFVRNLHNPNTWLFGGKHPVRVEAFRVEKDGKETPLPLQNETIHMNFERGTEDDWTGKIKIRLTNDFDRPLFVSLLYLSMNFQVYGKLLSPPVVELPPGRSVWLLNGQELELYCEPQVLVYNWKESVIHFKLIANTEYFDVDPLEQGALPAPGASATRDTGRAETREEEHPEAHDWVTRLITLRMANPELIMGDG